MKTNETLEEIISHTISNGALIQERMSGLGTILPFTGAKAAEIDAACERNRRQKLAESEAELAGMEKRTVGGEVRYYKTATIYTPAIKRGGVRRWFETRKDGDHAIK